MPTWYLAGTERYRGPVFAPAAGVGNTFDPANTLATITLSNSNLTATANTSAGSNASRCTPSHTTGKYYSEFTVTARGAGSNMGVGVVDSSFSLGSTFIGGDSHSCACYAAACETYTNNVNTNLMAVASYTTGDIIREFVDLDNHLIWWAVNGNLWNLGQTDASVLGQTGGQSIAALGATIYPAVEFEANSGASWTWNPGPGGFSFPNIGSTW